VKLQSIIKRTEFVSIHTKYEFTLDIENIPFPSFFFSFFGKGFHSHFLLILNKQYVWSKLEPKYLHVFRIFLQMGPELKISKIMILLSLSSAKTRAFIETCICSFLCTSKHCPTEETRVCCVVFKVWTRCIIKAVLSHTTYISCIASITFHQRSLNNSNNGHSLSSSVEMHRSICLAIWLLSFHYSKDCHSKIYSYGCKIISQKSNDIMVSKVLANT